MEGYWKYTSGDSFGLDKPGPQKKIVGSLRLLRKKHFLEAYLNACIQRCGFGLIVLLSDVTRGQTFSNFLFGKSDFGITWLSLWTLSFRVASYNINAGK
jgi:hypothetical protein